MLLEMLSIRQTGIDEQCYAAAWQSLHTGVSTMPTSDDKNESVLSSEAHEDDGELSVEALDKVSGAGLIYNKSFKGQP
jgi:hypothetical protein